jgi:hypothetical protein
MSKIAPDVLKEEARVTAALARRNDLKVGRDDFVEGCGAATQAGTRDSKGRGQLSTVAHKGKNGDKPPLMDSPLFHRANEVSHRGLPKLLIALHDLLLSDAGLFCELVCINLSWWPDIDRCGLNSQLPPLLNQVSQYKSRRNQHLSVLRSPRRSSVYVPLNYRFDCTTSILIIAHGTAAQQRLTELQKGW